MLKSTKMRDMPVITIHMYPTDKEALKHKAEEQGLQLTAYCRMILLKELKDKGM